MRPRPGFGQLVGPELRVWSPKRPKSGLMGTTQKPPDHGAALRVPPAHNARGWTILMNWLGEAGRRVDPGMVEVETPVGANVAAPGDWIVLSATGAYHVTKAR